MGYQDFVDTLNELAVEESSVQVLMHASGMAYESCAALVDVEEDEERVVLNFDNDNILVVTPGVVSIRQETEGTISIEGVDLLIELTVL